MKKGVNVKTNEVLITEETLNELKKKLVLKMPSPKEGDSKLIDDPMFILLSMSIRMGLFREIKAELFGEEK